MRKNLLSTATLLFILCVFFTHTSLVAQKWDGGGDGTSWEDPMNWDGDAVPALGAKVKLIDATITGTVPFPPAQVKVLKNKTVVLDLDMIIGDGITEEHALILAEGANLTLGTPGNNRAFSLNPAPNKQGMGIFGGSVNASYTIAESTIVSITQANLGVNVGNESSSLTNNGTLSINAVPSTAMKMAGTFTNNGLFTIPNVEKNGIVLTGNLFNGETGSLALISQNDTSTLIKVDTFAVFENRNDVTLSGAKDTASIVIKGMFNNMKDAYLTVAGGGIKVADIGTFTNTGLVTMDDGGLFQTNGTSTNNGFYDYGSNSEAFSGGGGTINDNGLPNGATVDAGGECFVDLAEAAYEWTETGGTGTSLGVADDSGNLALPANSLLTRPAALETSLTGVSITIDNFCDEALKPDGTDDPDNEVVTLSVFPTIAANEINIDLRTMDAKPMIFNIIDVTGKINKQVTLFGGIVNSVSINTLEEGLYIIRSLDADVNLLGKFILTK